MPDHGVTVIAGPSGSGKSTLLRLCNRLVVPTSGSVRYRGRPVEELDPIELRREVAMVFQRPTALEGTVADNLRAGAPDATDESIAAMLGRVGLAGMEDRGAEELSGGETQRMALARALMTGPRYVLFDEPTSSLDPSATAAIESLATSLESSGTPCCWVTHDLEQMRRMAHHLIVVIEGRVVQEGHLHEVLSDPAPAVRSFLEPGGRR
ncbi:MAG: ATP-binding cassette domain-containing protein [Microthrixaceae bacterium]